MLIPWYQLWQQHHTNCVHMSHIKSSKYLLTDLFFQLLPTIYCHTQDGTDANVNYDAMMLMLCCQQWHNIMPIVYMGHISKSDMQFLIDSLFCFSRCHTLCHDAEASNMSWCWHCSSSNTSTIMQIIYICHMSQLDKTLLTDSLCLFQQTPAICCGTEMNMLLWC